MKKNIYISIIIIFLSSLEMNGQDLHFSQFPQSALNLNPSNAGNFPADLRLNGMLRRQWNSVTVPYKTISIGGDLKLTMLNERLKGLGAGILINHDDAGDGQLRTLDIRLFTSFNKPINSDSIHFLRAGIMLGGSQRSVDFSKLTFDNQFNGDVWDPLAPTGENSAGEKVMWMDIGLGLGWEMVRENYSWDLGFSSTHINRPNQSFYSEKVRRPVLWQIHSTPTFKLNSNLTLLPSAVFMMQQEYRALNFGAELKIDLMQEPRKNYSFGIGLNDRWDDALIPFVAVYWNKFRIGFSYDVTTSSLKTVNNGRGGPEFSLVYLTKNIKARPQKHVICPVY